MAGRFAQGGLTATDIVVGINPGSTYGGAKRWLPERFAEVTERLCRTIRESPGQQVSVVIFGAKGEERLGQEIAARLSSPIPGLVRGDDDPGTHGGGETVCHASHE